MLFIFLPMHVIRDILMFLKAEKHSWRWCSKVAAGI